MKTPLIKAKCVPELDGTIPEPKLAADNLPAWFTKMPAQVKHPETKEEFSTFKRCLPTIDAMSAGIHLPLICDIDITDEGWKWTWKPPATKTPIHRRTPVANHPGIQSKGSPLEIDVSQAFVIFTGWWYFEMPEGWGLFFTHPVNQADLPFETLPGLVDVNALREFPVNFPVRWKDAGFRGTLKAGTPVAQAIPVPLGPTKLRKRAFNQDEVAHQRKFGMQNASKRYREARRKSKLAAEKENQSS